jgi:N-6 DNA Methylase/Domain of unknown function (DUF3387)
MSQNALQNLSQLEDSLWAAADNLGANSKLTSSEYCMPVLGVIFLRHALLEDLLRIFDSQVLRTASGDVFGRIYEYFLMKFAMQGAQDNGEFFTPPSLVQTIVNVIEPEHGIVFDPACGSGGMFAQSSHFIERLGQDTSHRVTFATLVELAKSLDVEQRRAAEEGLSEDELALFDLLKKDNLSKADRERVKLASRSLLDSVRKVIAPLERWTDKEQTQAEVEVCILDLRFQALPTPPFTAEEKQAVAKRVYQHVWQQSAAGVVSATWAA